MITYNDIILNKFVFRTANFPSDLIGDIWNLELTDNSSQKGEVRFVERNISNPLRDRLIHHLKTMTTDSFLLSELDKFHFDVNKMIKGEYVEMHNEVSQASAFEIVIWFTKNKFTGRDFIMEYSGGKKDFVHPHNNLVCFLDTTCLETRHGVSEMTSDTQVISITGGLGRKENYKC